MSHSGFGSATRAASFAYIATRPCRDRHSHCHTWTGIPIVPSAKCIRRMGGGGARICCRPLLWLAMRYVNTRNNLIYLQGKRPDSWMGVHDSGAYHLQYLTMVDARRVRAGQPTSPDLSGSGRVDMPTHPVAAAAAARAAVATGASG